VRCEEWLGWIMVSLNPDAPPVSESLAEVQELIGQYGMEDYTETFHRNPRVGHELEGAGRELHGKLPLAGLSRRHHRRAVEAGRDGLPAGQEAFNYHFILKDDSLKIALAHPSNTRLQGDWRRTTYLDGDLSQPADHADTGLFLVPVVASRKGVGQVSIIFGGGMSPDFVNDPEARKHFAQLKTLLDDVNVEDRGCTEKVYQGPVLAVCGARGTCRTWNGRTMTLPSGSLRGSLHDLVSAYRRGACRNV
jgi:hypothetical protein